ncbi:MAG: pilus assembly protein TadG-related protein, partial [Elioraea sp.]|nr:pilus assembly protein TadG-related protein [Elioraea sp.]
MTTQRTALELKRDLPGRRCAHANRGRGRTGLRLCRDDRGTTALLTGAVASVVVGFAGLVADGGTWYVARRNAQTAADAAAQAATLALLRGQDVTATARDSAARNGFDPASPDTTVRVRAFRRDPNP